MVTDLFLYLFNIDGWISKLLEGLSFTSAGPHHIYKVSGYLSSIAPDAFISAKFHFIDNVVPGRSTSDGKDLLPELIRTHGYPLASNVRHQIRRYGRRSGSWISGVK